MTKKTVGPMTPEQIAKSDTESAHQQAYFQWIALEGRHLYPDLDLMHAIPNGGDRTPDVGARMRAEGVKPGIPDTFLPVPKGIWHGLYIEFKRPALKPKVLEEDAKHGGFLNDGRSEVQRKMGSRLIDQRYAVVVAYTWEEAAEVVRNYYTA